MSRRRRGERGNTLLMCLTFVTLMGLMGAGTLRFQDTAARTQTAYEIKRTDDTNADNAIDSAVASIRYDLLEGRVGGGGGTTCSNPAAATTLVRYGDLEITCKPDPNSGRPIGTAPEAPDSVLIALGGVARDGNDRLDTSEADERVAFCDDWHSRTSDICETGIFIGRGVDAAEPETGGLLVLPNGSESGEPLVQSNGSIWIKDGDPDRTLKVGGEITARRSCHTGVQAGYDPDTGAADNSQRRCNLDDDADGSELIADPGYRHEWWNYTSGPAAGVQWPYSGTHPDQLPAVRSIPACGPSGFVVFQPGYYTNILGLNALMSGCPDALFWFRPGTYYFDFDNDDPTKWRDPNDFSQVVGGTPKNWNPCLDAGGNPLATGCAQTGKKMVANNINPDRWGTDYGKAILTDGITSSATLTGSVARLAQNKLQSPLPTRAGTSVQKVVFQITHRINSPVGQFAAGYPRARVRVSGVGACEFPLLRSSVLITETFDLTNGCPANCTVCGPFPAGASWTTTNVNETTATYEADSSSVGYRPTVSVDGMQFLIDFTGRPAPDYPNGCDPTQPGVQFIFGNSSRMDFQGNDVYWEMCGGRGTYDDHGVVLYGLTKASAPPTRVFRSELAKTGTPGWSGGNPTWHPTTPTRLFPAPVTASPATDAPTYNDIDGNFATSGAWTTTTDARAAFVLPNNLIPLGSVIERVEVRVRHYEREDDNGDGVFSPSEGPSGAASSSLNKLFLKITPGSVSGGAGYWNTDSYTPTGTIPFSYNDTTWVFGTGPQTPAWGALGTQADERSLTERMGTPQGINGAEIEFEARSNGTGVRRQVWLDGIELVVEYRQPGTLRPLRHCLTIRPANDPAALPTGYQMVGVDGADWAPRAGPKSDQPYGSGNGNADTSECALVRVGTGLKFHAQGTLYAPTAAFDLSGNDNEAAFATGGVIARHITAFRWKKGPGMAAFGGAVVPRQNRKVTLTATRGGKVIARATIEINDSQGENPGLATIVRSWIRHPQR